MKTRAVLLNSAGAVHRVIVGGDGADMTACGEHYDRAAPVTPVQARVFDLPECHGGKCWGVGAWEHFLAGAST